MSTDTIAQQVSNLLGRRNSLELATSSPDGKPLASYAPFVRLDGPEICVFLSSLAQHTDNIAANPRVSAMIVEDEAGCSNIFARERLILDCKTRRLERNSDEWNYWLKPYQEKFGSITDTLVQLADFSLHLLVPVQGTYVKGFGQAFRLTGSDLSEIRHITNPAREAKERPEPSSAD